MAYAIIHIKKHKTVQRLGAVSAHNERTRHTRNADPARREENERLLGSGDLCADVQARLDAAGITKVRANGVRAVEHYMTASPEWFHQASPTDVRAWVDANVEWAKERYGDNLVSMHLHMDETSPNIHAVMVPITPDGRLSATDYFGKPAQLVELQTSYSRSVEYSGLERGTFKSKAEHIEVQDWYGMVGKPTADAWKLARQVTIAPPSPGVSLEEQVAAAIAPALAAERTKAQYWQHQAEQTAAQLHGARAQRRAHDMSREEYGQLINRVRDTDLTDVMKGLGAKQDQQDPHKWHIGDKEINVRDQKYYDFHAPASDPLARRGGAIDLVQYASGRTFTESVAYLNDRHYSGRAIDAPTPAQEHHASVQNEERGTFQLPQDRPDHWPEVRRYLTRGRGLPDDLVDQAHDRGDLYATEHKGYPNAVFVRRNNEGQAVGAYMRGARGRFYGMAKDSHKEAGYFSIAYGTPNRLDKPSLIIVESPIDALSYAALKSTGHAYGRIISTDGYGPLPTEAIDETLQAGGTVRGAFDNDGPAGGGATLWQDMTDAYPKETHGDYTPIMRETPKAKDWNEDLQRTIEQAQSMGGFEMGR